MGDTEGRRAFTRRLGRRETHTAHFFSLLDPKFLKKKKFNDDQVWLFFKARDTERDTWITSWFMYKQHFLENQKSVSALLEEPGCCFHRGWFNFLSMRSTIFGMTIVFKKKKQHTRTIEVLRCTAELGGLEGGCSLQNFFFFAFLIKAAAVKTFSPFQFLYPESSAK